MAGLLVMYIFTGLLFVALGIPFIKGKVSPNSSFGLCVGETIDNEKVWYEANKHSGKIILKLGVLITIVACCLAPVLWSRPEAFGIILAFWFL